jgi:hypothetical protein
MSVLLAVLLGCFCLVIISFLSGTRYKLASVVEGDKEQIQWLYNACVGIPQVRHQKVFKDCSSTLWFVHVATIHMSYKIGSNIFCPVLSVT